MGEAKLTGTVLSALAMDMTSIASLPAHIACDAHRVTEANFSFNALHQDSLAELAPFTALETLVLDNNNLASLAALPHLPHLKTLWVNNNALDNLEVVLGTLSRCCPQLQYLSMLRNPCCPNELVGKQEAEYRRFRLYVKHRLPTLTRLDATVFSEEEAAEARERGRYCKTAVLKGPEAAVGLVGAMTEGSNAASIAARDDEEDEDLFAKHEQHSDGASPAPSGQAPPPKVGAGAFFTQQRHFYSGKASEGNRFIKDDVL
jgi:hypothetical protein